MEVFDLGPSREEVELVDSSAFSLCGCWLSSSAKLRLKLLLKHQDLMAEQVDLLLNHVLVNLVLVVLKLILIVPEMASKVLQLSLRDFTPEEWRKPEDSWAMRKPGY